MSKAAQHAKGAYHEVICPTCGRPCGTLKAVIAEMHANGLTPVEMRDELVSQGWSKPKSGQLPTIHFYLRCHLAVEPNH